jgi:hypothetical protein
VNLYGGKCHLCAHLSGSTHMVPTTWPVADDACPECSFCQEESFWGMLLRALGGERLFDPETRAALHAFRRGESHPLIDQLRVEMTQIDGGGCDAGR